MLLHQWHLFAYIRRVTILNFILIKDQNPLIVILLLSEFYLKWHKIFKNSKENYTPLNNHL